MPRRCRKSQGRALSVESSLPNSRRHRSRRCRQKRHECSTSSGSFLVPTCYCMTVRECSCRAGVPPSQHPPIASKQQTDLPKLSPTSLRHLDRGPENGPARDAEGAALCVVVWIDCCWALVQVREVVEASLSRDQRAAQWGQLSLGRRGRSIARRCAAPTYRPWEIERRPQILDNKCPNREIL